MSAEPEAMLALNPVGPAIGLLMGEGGGERVTQHIKRNTWGTQNGDNVSWYECECRA